MSEPASTPKKRGARAYVLLGLKVVVTLGLLGYLARSIASREGMDELGAQAAHVSLAPMLVAVLLHFVAVFSGVLRWRVLLAGRGIRLPMRVLLRSFLVGRFLGAFTPSTTGLDGYRLFDVARRTGDMAGSTATIAVEKLVGLVGMATVCLVLLPFGLAERLGVGAVLLALGMASVAAVGLFVMASPDRAKVLVRITPSPLRPRVDKIVSAILGGGLRVSTLGPALALGIVSHLALSGTFAASGLAFHAAAPITTLLSVGNAIVIAVLLPVSIGGVGVREGVAVALLAGAGIETSQAVLLALGSWLAGQVPALLGGLALLLPDPQPERPAALSAPAATVTAA
jgi:uncharacterized membrane protein YbhN (UPF0104 family)